MVVIEEILMGQIKTIFWTNFKTCGFELRVIMGIVKIKYFMIQCSLLWHYLKNKYELTFQMQHRSIYDPTNNIQ